MNTIVLTGGGTSGHIVPNLALIPKLKNSFDRICYIGSKNGLEKKLLAEFPFVEYFEIDTVKLIRKFTIKNCAIPFKLLKSISQAKHLLKQLNPNVIFSKGGYVSLPVALAGIKLLIPVICHESDLSMGLANRLVANKCKYVCTTFEITSKQFLNGIYSGTPLREKLFSVSKSDGIKRFGFSGKKPIILVTGGSQGSVAINKVLLKAIPELKDKFDILHISGSGNKYNINQDYYKCFEYISDMEYAFACSDIVISRGGSNTLYELFSLKKPTIVIPLNSSSRGDQKQNASYYESKGCCLVLLQENLTKDSLLYNINNLYRSRQEIISKIPNLPNGTNTIISLLQEFK